VTPLLDTSVLVRYLTFDPPRLGRIAQAGIERGDDLIIPTLAIAEAGFVLTKVYKLGRDDTIDLLCGLLGRANLRVLDMPNAQAIRALDLCRGSGRVSFTDALLWATALSSGNPTIYSFDRRFPNSGIDLRLLDGDSAPNGSSSA
jgi:predicted nucleic acid-binding protein